MGNKFITVGLIEDEMFLKSKTGVKQSAVML